jgi:pimeloyl-ACP methyl ester carboxylesterase
LGNLSRRLISSVASDVSAEKDAIRPDDALRRAGRTFLGMRVSIPIYEDALAALRGAGLSETAPMAIPASGPSLTTFPYDWRRSIVDAAQALGRAIESRDEGAEKVVLVGHSMGAAVALHYLMYGTQPFDASSAPPEITWAGAQHVRRAVLVAPPLRGAVVAIRNSVNGNHLAGPLVPTYPTTMLATHPSSFELMPRPDMQPLRDADGALVESGPLDAALWQREGWGLANPLEGEQRRWLAGAGDDPDARGLARQASLIERGRAYHRMADRPIDPPEGLDLLLIAGTGEDTPSAVQIVDDHEVKVVAKANGDGTVLYESAVAGFEEPHPRKRLVAVEAEHARIVSDKRVFSLILDAISEK